MPPSVSVKSGSNAPFPASHAFASPTWTVKNSSRFPPRMARKRARSQRGVRGCCASARTWALNSSSVSCVSSSSGARQPGASAIALESSAISEVEPVAVRPVDQEKVRRHLTRKWREEQTATVTIVPRRGVLARHPHAADVVQGDKPERGAYQDQRLEDRQLDLRVAECRRGPGEAVGDVATHAERLARGAAADVRHVLVRRRAPQFLATDPEREGRPHRGVGRRREVSAKGCPHFPVRVLRIPDIRNATAKDVE